MSLSDENLSIKTKKNKNKSIDDDNASNQKYELFKHTLSALNNIKDVEYKCRTCDVIKCDKHCYVCTKEFCVEHKLDKMIIMSKNNNNWKNAFYVFSIKIDRRRYKFLNLSIQGSLITKIPNESEIKFGKTIYIFLKLEKQYNLEKCVEILQDKLNDATFNTLDSKNKTIASSKDINGIMKDVTSIVDTSLHYDNNYDETRIYLNKSISSTLSFIYDSKVFMEIKLNSYMEVFKKLDPKIQKYFESLDVKGVIFPNKITLKRENLESTSNEQKYQLRIKITWSAILLIHIETFSSIVTNPELPQHYFEDDINPIENLNALKKLVDEYENELLKSS